MLTERKALRTLHMSKRHYPLHCKRCLGAVEMNEHGIATHVIPVGHLPIPRMDRHPIASVATRKKYERVYVYGPRRTERRGEHERSLLDYDDI